MVNPNPSFNKSTQAELKPGVYSTKLPGLLYIEYKKFIRMKRIYNLNSLYLAGLVDFLVKEYNNPEAIICFGSYSKGEDFEKSDIDIAIINGKEKDIALEKFEKNLGRKIIR